jgi:uncharacterized protein YceH (UPF0502 family)
MHLEVQLTPNEARLFGVLVEKALTTPEGYPLTLNAAINGANQKSNRDPVLSLDENEVAVALEGLAQKHLARKVFLEHSRVEKYTHRGGEMLNIPTPALATVAELLMRGPQTLGELRTRVSRMSPIESLDRMIEALHPLIEHGYVKRIDPAPGSRAERYMQLLSPDLHPIDRAPAAATASSHSPGLTERVGNLEAEVALLRSRLDELSAKLGGDEA